MFYGNTIPLVVDEIHPWFIEEALVGLQKTNSKNLLIQSNGGASVSLLWAVDCLKSRRLRTIGSGIVGSLAVILFLCGKKRLAFPDAEFFIHQSGYNSDEGRITSSFAQMKSFICRESGNQAGFDFWQKKFSMLKMFDELAVRCIVAQTNISCDAARKLLVGEKTFSTEEAMYYGIIHDIIQPKQVSVLSEFGIFEA